MIMEPAIMKTTKKSFLLSASVFALLMGFAGHATRAHAAAAGTVNLTVTPPDLTTSVDPNVVVSFDDSGSMASNYMGDNRPFDNGSWSGPWRCAGVIDPSATSGTLARAMNGVYYNPNILYSPPVYADGSSFPNADASLAAVWADGVAVNRPAPNKITPAATATYINNPNSTAGSNDARVANLAGVFSTISKTTSARQKTCPSEADAGSCVSSNCTGSGSSKTCFWSYTVTTDNRWTCGNGSYPATFVGGEDVKAGGPYYFRLISGTPIIKADETIDTSVLYNSANWEAVSVRNTTTTINNQSVNQWQNFANWYAYYRTRNLMTRTALSRVFAQFGSNIRLAWQTIGCPSGATEFGCQDDNGNFIDSAGVGGTVLNANTIITGLSNTNSAALNYRNKFFDFLFTVPATINTPDRRATIRAGEFFKRGNTSDLKDPYWQPADAVTGTPAQELSCRQNFHMLVTDGYWNESNPTINTPFYDSQTARTLPDGKAYSVSAKPSRVFWDVLGTKLQSSLANIAFNYWAQDLRSDLKNNVPAYYPDKTTGKTGSTALDPGADPSSNDEVYFNPANDPATWQHVVQFMVTLGVAGNLTYSDDVDCTATPISDLCALRTGVATSTTKTGWPTPANNAAPAIDDTWHAAVNSRGSYFSAGNPQELVSHLTQIIANVLVRSSSSTAAVTSLPFQTIGNAAFGGSYDSGDWSGRLLRMIPYDTQGNPITPPTIVWDAGCTLSGGNCPDGAKTAVDPTSRVILTSDGGTTGKAFEWGSLTTAQQALLNADPAKIAASASAATWTVGPDGFGSKRVDYLRGVRTYENPGAATDPQFRHRSSVLGAIINSQPVYNASAASGWADVFPVGSPEANVVGTDSDYQHFVDTYKARPATVYVGANDGMLHAFNAVTGAERWAFVPNTLIANGNITRMTDKSRGLTPGVDSQPTVQDVFINNAWHTVLVGSMRLGGRGVYALDITKPGSVTETDPTSTVLWEFSNLSTNGANLGYTFGRPNIARLNNGKWVVLVSSGYFPNGPVTDSYDDPASAEAAASQTSLFVLDLTNGSVIKELKTSTARHRPNGLVTYGLSQPGLYDLGGDQVDDIAVAGDLAGNLWRFDLTDANPNNWAVDLMFQTYPSSATNATTGTCNAAGKCPITVMPVGMRNPDTRGIVWIFGTGKYLGKDDRSNAIPAQSFYGIYDQGPDASNYPILPAKLNVQDMVESADASGTIYRFVSKTPITTVTNPMGWTLPLNIAAEAGERNVVTASALDTSNRVVLATLIPTTSDPCSPGRKGAIIVLDAATGNGVTVGDLVNSSKSGYAQSGVVDASGAIPSSGDSLPITAAIGGGILNVLGVGKLNIPDNYWYRTAWRRLLDSL